MSHPARAVLCTCPDTDTAENLAIAIVGSGTAACVNIVPGLTSVYRWQGEVKRDQEVLLIIKCHQGQVPELIDLIEREHPYDVPECIALPVIDGLPAYLDWVAKGGD